MAQIDCHLDETKLSQALSDPKFFDMCPAFDALRRSALAAAVRWKAALKDEGCGKCGAMKNMLPVINSFKQLAAAASTEELQTVRNYMLNRAGRSADRFVIQLRYKGQATHIWF